MTLEELLALEEGEYQLEFSDNRVEDYTMVVQRDSNIGSDTFYKRWITIVPKGSTDIFLKVWITLSDSDYLFFSTEAVPGLGIGSTTEPLWLQYLQVKKG